MNIFNKIISKLNKISYKDEYGWVINLHDALDVVNQVRSEGIYLSKNEYEQLLEYKYMYEELCK